MHTCEKRLGELVLRTENREALVAFYRDVIGLELFANFDGGTFLKVADDFDGHPQLMAIFDQTWEFSGPQEVEVGMARARTGTLHHFAFAMELEVFESEKARLEALEIEMMLTDHRQFGWHSIYLYDPDGNSVELVCYDEAILDAAANQRVREGVEG